MTGGRDEGARSPRLRRLPLGGRPNPQGGFGWGLRPLCRVQRFEDLPGDRGGIAQDVGVPEPKDTIALFPEPGVSRRIMRGLRAVGMMTAVELDDKTRFKTRKVRVIGTEPVLAPEFPSVIALQSQMTPQGALRRRCVLSEIARAFVGQNHPHPKFYRKISASPQGGGGGRMKERRPIHSRRTT